RDTTAETYLAHEYGPLSSSSRQQTEAVLARVCCPVLAIHGDQDRCEPWARSERLAALTGGEFLLLAGAGGAPNAREPVVVNRAIQDFAERFRPASPVSAGRRTWTRP